MRLHHLWKGSLLLSTYILLMGTALAGAVNINGNCALGNCASPDILAPGASLTNPFDFVYTFANSDRYQVTGTLNAFNTSTPSGEVFILIETPLTVTYLGNNAGTTSGTDVLTIRHYL